MTPRRPHFRPGVLPLRERVGDDVCDERWTTTAGLTPNGESPSDHHEPEADVDEPPPDQAASSGVVVDLWDGVFRPDDPRCWWLHPDEHRSSPACDADEDGIGTDAEPEGDNAA